MNKLSDTKSSSSDIILSIITVVKNDAIRLSRTVDSLKSCYEKSQIEHIVVDANSYDETITILNKINLYKNVKILSETDKGIYDGMNKGVSLSSGAYLLFLNCGDQMLADENQILTLLSKFSDADIVCFLCHLNDGKTTYELSPNLRVKHKTPTSHQAMIFSRSFMTNHLYNANYQIAADYDLYLSADSNRVCSANNKSPLTSIQLVGYSSENPVLAYKEYLLIAYKRLRGFHRVVTLIRIALKAVIVIGIKKILPTKYLLLIMSIFR